VDLKSYQVDASSFDEMFAADGSVRPLYREIAARLGGLDSDDFDKRRRMADLLLRNQGVTFTV
jgi:uncharacterized circularly permuted ATP-grasp superfamily protein